MSFQLQLSGNSSTFSAVYFPPIVLKKNSELALLSIDTWNSFANINSKNNEFHYKINGKEEVIKIPTGSYEITDIECYLQKALRPKHLKNPLTDDQKIIFGDDKPLILRGNHSTFKTEFVCRYDVNFSKPKSIGTLLGFKGDKKYEAFKLHESNDIIQILRVETLNLECNLITNSYKNGTRSQILYSVNISTPPGYKIRDHPVNLLFLPLNTREIDQIEIKLTDQNGKLVDLRGEHTSIRLYLREIA